MMKFFRRWLQRPHVGAGPRLRRPLRIEALEDRTVPAVNVFASPTFQSQIQLLLASNNLPQISIAADLGNMPYTYTYSNPGFSGFGGQAPPPLTPNSLFRIASISKPLAAAAILKLVQDGHLHLTDKAFQLLGFFDAQGKPVPLSGYDPLSGQPVTVQPSTALLPVTVQSLLNMSSGLPINVPVASAMFPTAGNLPVLYIAGNYASLAFAGAFNSPPYAGPPASVYQQIRGYVFEFSNNGLTLTSPGSYAYSDTGYAILGAIAETVSEQTYGLSYGDYLQQYILGPMGIQPPSANPAPGTPMAAIAGTLQSQAYPTEIGYYANANEPPRVSVFPDHNATAPPFYAKVRAPQPYGGSMYLESHFGQDGLVATPLALTTFFADVWAAYNGATTGPLSPATVREMVDEANGTHYNPSSWYGLGWTVSPGIWSKNGGIPGTSSLLDQYADGTTWAYVLNEDLGTAQQDFVTALTQDVNSALYGTTPISITGKVFIDANGNGTLDSGEAGQPGQIVYLDLKHDGMLDSGDPSTTTDSNGGYSFTGLSPAAYTVRALAPSGWTQTTPNPSPITGALNGAAVTGVNFGNFQLASINGTAFMDRNGNGVQDQGDWVLPGQTVFIDENRDGVLGQAAAIAYGRDVNKPISGGGTVISNAFATGIVNPIQKVTVTLNLSAPIDASIVASLTSPSGATVLLVNRKGSGQNFTGTIFDDSAANSISLGAAPFSNSFRPEQPLAAFNGGNADGAWMLQLTDFEASGATLLSWFVTVTTVEPSTHTDAKGNFSFPGLPPGLYSAREIAPTNWVQTTLNPVSVVVSASGAKISGVKIGNFSTTTVSGTVFNDLNANHVKDPGEPGLSGRSLFLDQNNDGILNQDTTTLAAQDPPLPIPDLGTAASEVLATGLVGVVNKITVSLNIAHPYDGDLRVFLVAPSGLRVLLVNRRGHNGSNFTNTVLDDQAATPISAGAAPFTGSFQPEKPLAAFVGRKPNGTWLLEVSDAAPQDVGVIQGWSLTIVTTEPTATTDANGNYVFGGLGPGTYVVREILPAVWAPTTANPVVLNVAVTGIPVTGVNYGQVQQLRNVSTASSAQQPGGVVQNRGNRQSTPLDASSLAALDLDEDGFLIDFAAGRRRRPRNGR